MAQPAPPPPWQTSPTSPQPPGAPSAQKSGRGGFGVVVVAVTLVAAAVGFFGLRALDDNDDDSASSSTRPSLTAAPPTEPAPDGALPVAAAASAAETAIGLGDSLSYCPFGPTAAVIALVPASIDLAAGFDQGVIEYGEVFSGGDVDITYCDMVPSDYSDGPVGSIRIDVAPLSDVDLDVYMDEEFGEGTAEDFGDEEDFVDGALRSICITYPEDSCLAVWQGDGLFVSTILRGEGPIVAGDAIGTAAALLPLVIANLAAHD